MSPKIFSFLELAKQVDDFAYDPKGNVFDNDENVLGRCYEFWLSDSTSCVGWMLPWVVERMPWIEG